MNSQNIAERKDPKRINHAAFRLAILCMGFYAVSYICRKSFDSNINEIMDFFGQTKPTVGLIGTFFFIAYAVGQVFHGIMCKFYKPRAMVFTMGLVVAGMNLTMGLIPVGGFGAMKFVWLINGFACASFWSLLILTLNKSVAKKYKQMVLVVSCLPVSTGTFLSYGISALLSFLHRFQWAFYIACGTMVVMTILWLVRSRPLIDACIAERDELDGPELDPVPTETGAPAKKSGWTKSFILLFSFLALFAIIDNLVKDGLSSWTPSILRESYDMENWLSVLLSVLVPLVGVLGGLLSIRLYNKVKDSVVSCQIFFLIAGITMVILLLTFPTGIWGITLACLMVVSLLMSSINNIITAIFPMNCETVNAGTVAGVVDGFCYVGSAISSYGLGALSEKGGWNAVFYLLLAGCFACVVLGIVYALFLKKKNEKAVE